VNDSNSAKVKWGLNQVVKQKPSSQDTRPVQVTNTATVSVTHEQYNNAVGGLASSNALVAINKLLYAGPG